MAGKKKTTFTKMARESKLRERRQEKAAKKEARRQAGGLHHEADGLHHEADGLDHDAPIETPVGEHDDAGPDAQSEPAAPAVG